MGKRLITTGDPSQGDANHTPSTCIGPVSPNVFAGGHGVATGTANWTTNYKLIGYETISNADGSTSEVPIWEPHPNLKARPTSNGVYVNGVLVIRDGDILIPNCGEKIISTIMPSNVLAG